MLANTHISLIVFYVMNAIVSDPAVQGASGDPCGLGGQREVQHIHFAPALGTKVSAARFRRRKHSHVSSMNRNFNATPVLHRRFRLPCPPSGPLVQ
jgi:hypothetical protein